MKTIPDFFSRNERGADNQSTRATRCRDSRVGQHAASLGLSNELVAPLRPGVRGRVLIRAPVLHARLSPPTKGRVSPDRGRRRRGGAVWRRGAVWREGHAVGDGRQGLAMPRPALLPCRQRGERRARVGLLLPLVLRVRFGAFGAATALQLRTRSHVVAPARPPPARRCHRKFCRLQCHHRRRRRSRNGA